MKSSLRITAIIVLVLALVAFALIYDRGASEVYDGGLKDGLPHGFGIWKHSSGVYYAGDFYEGLWHGRGTWIHPEGIKYAGEWRKGEYHGRGTLILLSGARYDGFWFEGKKHGPGIYRWPDGQTYTGWWAFDRHEGFGILENPDGFSYRGDWHDGRRNGEGSAIYPDGSEYYGQWLNDMRHGQGTMIFFDGTIYEGGWSEDKQHGEGTLISPDGTVLIAVWIKGRLQVVVVETISIDPSSLNLIAGGATATLIAEIYPEEATNREITWATTNPAVATVSDGLVRPVAPGSATITATTTEGGYTAICTVTVRTTAISVTGVSLDRTSITIRVGETATLVATVTPTNATNPTVNWTSSDSTIAAVYQESGRRGGVRAFNPGEVWVTVTTIDGHYTARCQVTILAKDDPANTVIVPHLIGKSLSEAKTLIADTGLIVGEIISEFHESAPADQVISQNPAVGASINKGSVVNLTISKGPEPKPEPEPAPEPEEPQANGDE